MHGVAAAGFVAGKYLGKLIGTDKMVDKLVGNKAAEESNASYTDAMKKQVEEQNKNRKNYLKSKNFVILIFFFFFKNSMANKFKTFKSCMH